MEEENKKSSKKVGIIITVIIVILLIAGIVAWYIISNMDKNKPDEVFYAYIECLKKQDYEGMYSLISESTKQRVDKDTFLSRNKNIYEGIEATNIKISNLVYNEENKSIDYDMSFDTLIPDRVDDIRDPLMEIYPMKFTDSIKSSFSYLKRVSFQSRILKVVDIDIVESSKPLVRIWFQYEQGNYYGKRESTIVFYTS